MGHLLQIFFVCVNVDISGLVFIIQADQSTPINIKRTIQRLEISIFHHFYL